MYLGADGFYLERCNDAQPWTYSQKPVEIIIHKEYNKKVKKGKVQFQRKDHDIALLRMEYPIWDYKTGLGSNRVYFHRKKYFLGARLLQKKSFNADELIPICLPSSNKFKDTGKGIGLL